MKTAVLRQTLIEMAGGEETTVSKTAKGELIRLKQSDTAPVWVRGHYDRATRTYSLSKADDMNHETFVKGTRKCFVGFTY